MNEWRNPMDMVVAEAESRLAAVKASYEAKLAARDAEWRAAVERLRREHTGDGCVRLAGTGQSWLCDLVCGANEHNNALDALLAAMEVPHDGQ